MYIALCRPFQGFNVMKTINSSDDLVDAIEVVYDEDNVEVSAIEETKGSSVRRRIEDLLEKKRYQKLLADFEDEL